MKIVVLANNEGFEIIKKTNRKTNWIRVDNISSLLLLHENADAFFNLLEDAGSSHYPETEKPLFINSVLHTVDNKKMIRINGWNGFLENNNWEVAGNIKAQAKEVLLHLNKTIIQTADEPGFISARIIAMIINEAYYAKGESVSTEAAIDTAMKLGTNYPYGPFEWAQKIGVNNIHQLLAKLSLQDNRYQPAPLLKQSILF